MAAQLRLMSVTPLLLIISHEAEDLISQGWILYEVNENEDGDTDQLECDNAVRVREWLSVAEMMEDPQDAGMFWNKARCRMESVTTRIVDTTAKDVRTNGLRKGNALSQLMTISPLRSNI